MKLQSLLKHIIKNLENDDHPITGLLRKGEKPRDLEISYMVAHHEYYEVEPTTHKVNGYDTPLPLSVEPNLGTEYFIMQLVRDNLYHATLWGGADHDCKWIRRGLAFAKRQDAQKNALATLGHNPETTNVEDV